MQVGFMQGTKLALVHTQPRAKHYLAEVQEADPVSILFVERMLFFMLTYYD